MKDEGEFDLTLKTGKTVKVKDGSVIRIGDDSFTISLSETLDLKNNKTSNWLTVGERVENGKYKWGGSILNHVDELVTF